MDLVAVAVAVAVAVVAMKFPCSLGYGRLARPARMLGHWPCVVQAVLVLLYPLLLLWISPQVLALVLIACLFEKIHDCLLRGFAVEIMGYIGILSGFCLVSWRHCLLLFVLALLGVSVGRAAWHDARICLVLLMVKLFCNALKTELMTRQTMIAAEIGVNDSASKTFFIFRRDMALYMRDRTDVAPQTRAVAARNTLLRDPFSFFICYMPSLTRAVQGFVEFNLIVPMTEQLREQKATELSLNLTWEVCVLPVLVLRVFGHFMVFYACPVLLKLCFVLLWMCCQSLFAALMIVWSLPATFEQFKQGRMQYCRMGGLLCSK
jgi:hypothetical protein